MDIANSRALNLALEMDLKLISEDFRGHTSDMEKDFAEACKELSQAKKMSEVMLGS